MSTELTRTLPAALALSLDDTMSLGQVFAKSGYFSDAKAEAQAVVKILFGREFGIQPVSAMMGIHIIQGKPTLSANLMAAIVKTSKRYDYKVTTLTDEACQISFFEDGERVGYSGFSVEDARKAGLLGNPTWQKFPRNMCFSRALSNGCRWYCPDLFGGAPVYSPEELGADVDESGEVVRPQDTPNRNGHHDPPQNEPAPEPPITRVQASEILTANDPPVSRCKDCGNTKVEGHKPECRHYKKAKPQEPAEPAAPQVEYQPSTKQGWDLQNATFHAILHEAGIDSKDRPLVHHIAGLILDVTPPPASMSDLNEHEYKTLNDKARQIGPEGLLLAAKGFDPFEAIPAAGRAA